MRITFVLPGRSLHGGIKVVATYGNKLIERGHHVTILHFSSPWPRRPGPLTRRLWSEATRIAGFNRDHLHDFKGRVLSTRVDRLGDATADGDCVIATHWLTADPVAGLPSCKGRKFYFLQGYEAHIFDPKKVDATWRLPMRKIVISSWLADMARSRFDDTRAVLIPNGVDTRSFDAPPRDRHHPPTVGVMYSTAAMKAVAVAFEAIRLVRRQIPELRVVSFGATRPELALPLPEGTEFHHLPAQQKIREIYAAADVWLCSSTSEGFGLPILEAMACRCPVVSTRCGGPADIVEEGRNGYLVEIGDAGAMAGRVLEILSDDARWRRMSDAAFETRLRFTWENSVRRFEEVLREV